MLAHSLATKKWRLKNKERTAELQRRYRARHVEEMRAYNREYAKKNKDRISARTKERVTPEMRKARFESWNERKLTALAGGRPRADKCDACQEVRKTVFDHCHAGGHFRGWLCPPCNLALGMVRDSPERLRSLADYLEVNRTPKSNHQVVQCINEHIA